ncbi:perilipin-4-like [Pipra filicauda]|uniref:Perilipin-4-like n=1 Tax=Pipra filicauda TaxID=649802 RepID=A0A7R5KAP8_9PASS|nr:perilipin-4-like [Pipra filicauda]
MALPEQLREPPAGQREHEARGRAQQLEGEQEPATTCLLDELLEGERGLRDPGLLLEGKKGLEREQGLENSGELLEGKKWLENPPAAAEFSMASGKTPKPDLLKAEEQQQVSAVNRVTSLPLLNSAFNLVSSAYNHTKESHPCLSGVCNVAETVAAVAVGSVVGGAQPILNQLEPHIALVNEYACKGLDQLEENLPFLQQPADKVLSDTKQLVSTKVTSAMDAACEAREAVADKVTEAVDLTKNVVGDSVKLTRSVVTSTVNSAVEAAQGAKELVTTKVTEAVDVTKHMVEDSVDRTKSAVASTISAAVGAAQGAKELVTNKVTEAVDVTKHMVEDKVDRTKSAVASTIVNAVEAAQGAKELVTNKVTEAVEDTKSAVASTISAAVGAAQGAKDMVTSKVTEAVDATKHVVEDSVDRTKSAVASTIVNAVEAAQGAKELVADKVTKAVDLSKHIVEDSVDMTKSAVASTIVNAVEAAQGAKELVANKVTEAVDVTKHMVEDSVDRTKSAVASTISAAVGAAQGAKELVTNKVTEAVDLTKGAVQDSVEKTKSVVTSTAKAVSQAVTGGVESVLGMSEDLVDHFLPMTEEELGKLATSVEGSGMVSVEEQKEQRSYFVRLGSLSSRVRLRAYQHSLHKLQCIRQSTQDTLSRLQMAIKLIESVKQGFGQKLLEGQEKLHKLWVDWCLTQPKGNQVQTACQPEQVESRTLTMLRIITQQLQPVYENLKTSIQGLPSNVQEAVYQATRNIHKLHSSFSSAMSFQDLSSITLRQSQDRATEARRSLDVLLEYVTHSTPLNWLVGPFRAMVEVAQGSRKQKRREMVTDGKLPPLEKAPASQGVTETPGEPEGSNRILGQCPDFLCASCASGEARQDVAQLEQEAAHH